MLTTGNQRPRGLSPFAALVYDVLEDFVVSPWHQLGSACAPNCIDPLALSAADLDVLVVVLGDQVARVCDEEHALELMRRLSDLADSDVSSSERSATTSPRA